MEFEINGQQYRSGKLNAFQQQHIVRRLAPLLGALAPSLQRFKDDPLKAFEGLAEALARMPDADVDYVTQTCLSVVHRQQGVDLPWVRVMPSGGKLAFDDIGLLELNELLMKVLQDNLGSFFNGLVSRVSASPSTASTP